MSPFFGSLLDYSFSLSLSPSSSTPCSSLLWAYECRTNQKSTNMKAVTPSSRDIRTAHKHKHEEHTRLSRSRTSLKAGYKYNSSYTMPARSNLGYSSRLG
jgi:hypothetical protein